MPTWCSTASTGRRWPKHFWLIQRRNVYALAGQQLATLHALLHEVPPLVAGAGCLLYLDLHLENVLMTRDGPVVIDWTNAEHGPPEIDVAMT